jgi:hypothetical protein
MLTEVMEHFGLRQELHAAGFYETEHHRQTIKDIRAKVGGGLLALCHFESSVAGEPHSARAGSPITTGARGPEFRCGRKFCDVIPEMDIWRAATLMLKRYGDRALEESASRADELASAGDDNGVAVWRRISDAVGRLVNTTPPAAVH